MQPKSFTGELPSTKESLPLTPSAENFIHHYTDQVLALAQEKDEMEVPDIDDTAHQLHFEKWKSEMLDAKHRLARLLLGLSESKRESFLKEIEKTTFQQIDALNPLGENPTQREIDYTLPTINPLKKQVSHLLEAIREIARELEKKEL